MKSTDQLRSRLESKVPAYIQEALEGICTGERYSNFNFNDAKKCIEWNYTKCGYRVPLIIITENPLEMQLMFNYIKHINTFLETRHTGVFVALRAQLLNQLSANPQTHLGVQLESMLRSRIGSRKFPELDSNFIYELDRQLNLRLYSTLFKELDVKLENKLSSQLSFALKTPLRAVLGEQLGEALDSKIKCIVGEQEGALNYVNPSYLFTTNFYSDCIYAWYEFTRKELELPLSINEDFQTCFQLQRKSGIAQAVFSEDVCVISKYPCAINCDFEDNQHKIRFVRWGATSLYTLLDNRLTSRRFYLKLASHTTPKSTIFPSPIWTMLQARKAV